MIEFKGTTDSKGNPLVFVSKDLLSQEEIIGLNIASDSLGVFCPMDKNHWGIPSRLPMKRDKNSWVVTGDIWHGEGYFYAIASSLNWGIYKVKNFPKKICFVVTRLVDGFRVVSDNFTGWDKTLRQTRSMDFDLEADTIEDLLLSVIKITDLEYTTWYFGEKDDTGVSTWSDVGKFCPVASSKLLLQYGSINFRHHCVFWSKHYSV